MYVPTYTIYDLFEIQLTYSAKLIRFWQIMGEINQAFFKYIDKKMCCYSYCKTFWGKSNFGECTSKIWKTRSRRTWTSSSRLLTIYWTWGWQWRPLGHPLRQQGRQRSPNLETNSRPPSFCDEEGPPGHHWYDNIHFFSFLLLLLHTWYYDLHC